MLGISLRTAQLWAESGLIKAWKTKGGHRRISRSSVQRMLDGEITGTTHPLSASAPERCITRLKILVIEDDIVLLKLYKAVLSNWKLPIDLITAGNGIEGLIHIGRESPDLMIVDLSLPSLDGFKLIHSLADSSFGEGMEIVVVTGMDRQSIAAQGGLPEGIRLFSKPVPFGELKNLVLRLLEQRASYL